MQLFRFALNKIANVLENYQAPLTPFQPAGNWVQQYEMLTIGTDRISKQGSLAIARKADTAGNTVLRLDCGRNAASGFSHFVRAELTCIDNSISTPISWSFSTKLAKSLEDEAYLHSGLEKEACVVDGELKISVKGKEKRIALPGAYTCKWCLLDAVQRLPEAGMEPEEFWLIDEFDQVRGKETLQFRHKEAVLLSGKPAELTAYQVTGMGLLPTVYFRDEYGRLLFIISGLEAYVLTNSPAWEAMGGEVQ
jgi:hypothetical protein